MWQKTGKSVPALQRDQRKERHGFCKSLTADSDISSPLRGNYTL